MNEDGKITTGIKGLDEIIGGLRAGDSVAWQIDSIADYIYVATRFVVGAARSGKRIVYIRFGSHGEVVDADGLIASGANLKKYELDPRVGFETFGVQVYHLIKNEGKGAFFIFDCISELQKYWFSDHMVGNLFFVTAPVIEEQESMAYIPLMYERHTYETTSRILHSASVLMNMRSLDGSLYILPVKVSGRKTRNMYFPIRLHGEQYQSLTSSADTYALFDKFTQTGEKRDCWDKMFDHFVEGSEDVTDDDGVPLRNNIIQCLLGTEPKRFELCRRYFTTQDLIEIKKREIGTGCIGGKAAGMLLARNVLRDADPEFCLGKLEPHDSYFIGADVFYSYSVQNNCWRLRTRMVKPEDYMSVAPELKERLLYGEFTRAIREQFTSVLEYFGQSPIIVRSSSLLEDGFGNAFAGKYESVFCPNQGSLAERYEVFEQAVRTVYASTLNRDAVAYRTERNLLDRDEQMALLVMRVAGDCHGSYFYPHMAGVGHSRNLYACSAGTAENKGMLRLVMGMGTRAVEREADDYARLISLDNPTAPPRVAYGDEYRYSQHKIDVIDLEANAFTTVRAGTIGRNDLKADPALFMEPDHITARKRREAGIIDRRVPDIINFGRLLKKTDFSDTMARILKTLEEKYSYPVDIEFACNFYEGDRYKVNLLQCRPLQAKGMGALGTGTAPEVEEYIFRTKGNFMGGNVCVPVDYIVFVGASAYLDLSYQKKYQVARTIGRLNGLLKKKNAVLIGPGRWGTTTPSLGVPVNFMEISNFISISEVAYNEKGLCPELSYGSHFFQDLVEAGAFYTAIYQGDSGCLFREELLTAMTNRFNEIMRQPDSHGLDKVIGVYDVSKRKAVLYSEIESRECFLAFKKRG